MKPLSSQPATGRRRPHPDRPDTEAAFAELARTTDPDTRHHLQEDLVHAWLPMARRLARRYRERGEDTEDLQQVAALGLTKAVQRFQPQRGHAFESYAVPVITGELRKHFRDHTWAVHVPRRVQELRNRVRTATRDWQTHAGRDATTDELAEYLDLTPEEVRQGQQALHSYRTLSLEAAPTDPEGDSRPLADQVGEEDSRYERITLYEAVEPAVRRLPYRERRALYLRFYREQTQSAIAEELGVSQMQVSRILRQVCARIRQEVDPLEPAEAPAVQGHGATGDAEAPESPGRAGDSAPRQFQPVEGEEQGDQQHHHEERGEGSLRPTPAGVVALVRPGEGGTALRRRGLLGPTFSGRLRRRYGARLRVRAGVVTHGGRVPRQPSSTRGRRRPSTGTYPPGERPGTTAHPGRYGKHRASAVPHRVR